MVEQPAFVQNVQPAPGREPGRVQHEPSDLRLAPIVGIVALLAVAIALAAGSAWLLFIRHRRLGLHLPWPTDSATSPIQLPNQPRLEAFEPQPGASETFAASEQAAEASLHAYGPTNELGFVHIPIEQAMRSLAKELSSQSQPEPLDPKSRGLIGSGDANSGRLLRGGSP